MFCEKKNVLQAPKILSCKATAACPLLFLSVPYLNFFQCLHCIITVVCFCSVTLQTVTPLPMSHLLKLVHLQSTIDRYSGILTYHHSRS